MLYKVILIINNFDAVIINTIIIIIIIAMCMAQIQIRCSKCTIPIVTGVVASTLLYQHKYLFLIPLLCLFSVKC